VQTTLASSGAVEPSGNLPIEKRLVLWMCGPYSYIGLLIDERGMPIAVLECRERKSQQNHNMKLMLRIGILRYSPHVWLSLK